jgi:hypothetical protein
MNYHNIGSFGKPNVPYMNTLTACVNKMTRNGYTDNLTINKQGLFSIEKNKTYSPEDIKVIDFYRFEGQSDPADNAIMYVIETDDGVKGMIVDAYGHYADDSVARFMKHVEEINKNVDKK